MRVWASTPALRHRGLGRGGYVGNRFAPVDFWCRMHRRGRAFERRLDEVYTGVKVVIRRTKPEVLAIEKLFYQHHQTTVIPA